MGVKYSREYRDIIYDLMDAISKVGKFYEFCYMDASDWNKLDDKSKWEYLRTLSDDVFYGLGTEGTLNIGSGVAKYDRNNHIIKLYNGDKCVSIVNLI